jgi:hypothetical protein
VSRDSTDGKFKEEVEDRLENLFAEDELSDGEPALESERVDSPLRELKTIVLSIDWEITDEAMIRFVEQVNALQDIYQNDKIVLVFLQLLGSIGEYIRINLGKSHPDAFKILSSLFEQLDTVVQAEDLTEADKKKILAAELNKYKKLKSQLVPLKAATEVRKTPPPAADAAAEPALSGDLHQALADMKQTLASELKTIMEELKKIRQDLAKH